MTTPSTERKAGPLLGTGSQTVWPFTFKVFGPTDIAVTIANSLGVETTLIYGTDYSVTLNANQETSPGGSVTYPISGSPLPVGSVITMTGNLSYDQPLDLPSGGNFSPLALENQLDRMVMQTQQLKEEVDRSVKLPVTSQATADDLIADVVRIADSADNIDIVADDITNVNAVGGSIGNVNIVAADLSEPVSEINTVANSIANVDAVGQNIANVNTVAANETAINDVSANMPSVIAAPGAAATAASAALAAETARDAAQLFSKIYQNTAAGLAATSSGEYFSVPYVAPDGLALTLYRNNAGVADEITSIISSLYFDTTLTDLSDWAFAIVDDGFKYAFSIDKSGACHMPNTYNWKAIYQQQMGDLSDIMWAVVDDAGRMPLALTKNGALLANGVELDIDALNALLSQVSGQLTSGVTVNCWGDSMTNGGTVGVTTTYPQALQSLFAAASDSRTVLNRGISGMTSQQISSKFGAKPSMITLASNTIPASGPATVTATDNSNLSSKSNYGTLTYSGSLFGVPGTLAVQWNSVSPDLPGPSTFTRATAGSAVLIPQKSPFRPSTGGWENDIAVIWAGRNDVLSGTSFYTNDDIIANIRLMVDFIKLPYKRFIILAVTDASWEANGSAAYNQILDLNYRLSVLYPDNWIDVRKVLVNSYNPALPNDVTAFNNDKIPPSLSQDGLHLNNAGYAIVAQSVYNFIVQKGW